MSEKPFKMLYSGRAHGLTTRNALELAERTRGFTSIEITVQSVELEKIQAELAQAKQMCAELAEIIDLKAGHEILCAMVGGYGYCNCYKKSILDKYQDWLAAPKTEGEP